MDGQLGRRLTEAGPHPGRDPRVIRETEARNRLRDEAARLSQQLVIQREAIGLVRHGLVHERYPVPPLQRV